LGLHNREVSLDLVLREGSANLHLLGLDDVGVQICIVNSFDLFILVKCFKREEHLLLYDLGDRVVLLFQATEPDRDLCLIWLGRQLMV
jgi:hypothetical protein